LHFFLSLNLLLVQKCCLIVRKINPTIVEKILLYAIKRGHISTLEFGT
jgi:hypothetical protein